MYWGIIMFLLKKSVAPITRQMRLMRAHLTLLQEMGAIIITVKEKSNKTYYKWDLSYNNNQHNKTICNTIKIENKFEQNEHQTLKYERKESKRFTDLIKMHKYKYLDYLLVSSGQNTLYGPSFRNFCIGTTSLHFFQYLNK